MALFNQQQDPTQDIMQLRMQGLTDEMIVNELGKKGMAPAVVQSAISKLDADIPPADVPMGAPMGMPSGPGSSGGAPDGNIYERIEEITEGIVDEKWDELIAEVRKIIEWKTKVEGRIKSAESNIMKLQEDFKTLHVGVLGKLESYDERMSEVGSELKAVGKVFKDVVPVFVENVKKLKHHVEHKK